MIKHTLSNKIITANKKAILLFVSEMIFAITRSESKATIMQDIKIKIIIKVILVIQFNSILSQMMDTFGEFA